MAWGLIALAVSSNMPERTQGTQRRTREAAVPIRILLDQNTPLGLRHALPGYEVLPARGMGWASIENGELIRLAEEAGFAILITCDRNIRYQQNLIGRKIALIELTTTIWPVIRPRVHEVLAAVEAATPGSYATVTLPRPRLRRRPPPRFD
jgi:hypothetical protein